MVFSACIRSCCSCVHPPVTISPPPGPTLTDSCLTSSVAPHQTACQLTSRGRGGAGLYKEAVYSVEQQLRLGVDKFGRVKRPSPSKGSPRGPRSWFPPKLRAAAAASTSAGAGAGGGGGAGNGRGAVWSDDTRPALPQADRQRAHRYRSRSIYHYPWAIQCCRLRRGISADHGANYSAHTRNLLQLLISGTSLRDAAVVSIKGVGQWAVCEYGQ